VEHIRIYWVELVYTLLVAVAAGCLCTTVAKTKAFTWLRVSLARMRFLGSLVKCPYCLAHWVCWFALAGSDLYPLRSMADGFLVVASDFLVTWLLMVAVAGITSGLLCRALLQMEKAHVNDPVKVPAGPSGLFPVSKPYAPYVDAGLTNVAIRRGQEPLSTAAVSFQCNTHGLSTGLNYCPRCEESQR
jgi:hypothetical protein